MTEVLLKDKGTSLCTRVLYTDSAPLRPDDANCLTTGAQQQRSGCQMTDPTGLRVLVVVMLVAVDAEVFAEIVSSIMSQ